MQKKCLLPITNPVNTRKSGKQFLREGSSPPSEWKESFRMIRVRGSKTIASRYCRLECTKKLDERIRSNRRKTGWWNCLIHAWGAHSCDSWTKDGKLYSSAFFSIREPRPIRITEHESDGVVWGKSKSKLWRERGRERERERESVIVERTYTPHAADLFENPWKVARFTRCEAHLSQTLPRVPACLSSVFSHLLFPPPSCSFKSRVRYLAFLGA